MIRLFITLYLFVIAAFGVYTILYNITLYIGENYGDVSTIGKKVSKGTFLLLNQSLEGLNPNQQLARFEHYKTIFGEGFDLADPAKYKLNKQQLKQIENGETVSIEAEPGTIIKINHKSDDDDTDTILYHQLQNSSLVWQAYLDFTVDSSISEKGVVTEVKGGKFAEGMFFLIEKQLLEISEKEWPAYLKQLQPDYGLSLRIEDPSNLSGLPNSKELISQVKKGEVVNITQDTESATLVHQIPHSNRILQIGPTKLPWFYLNGLYFLLAYIPLSLALTLLFWLYPLWSNLISIKKATDQFGAGDYSTRIPVKRFSSLNKITQAFNKMAERTQHSIRSHKQLTSAVSHELRTPLARMRFALEMLTSNDKHQDKQRYIDDINQDIDELDLLLEELLTYARLDQGDAKLKIIQTNLLPWFQRSMKKLVPLAHDRELHYQAIELSQDDIAFIEPRLMSRVLDNLVQNALRYSKQQVSVSLSKTDEYYQLSVDDDGIGIPQKERKHIFDAFSRIDTSRDRASGGFGLGLAIAAQIIERHHGEISVMDSKMGGVCFQVLFHKQAQ